MNIVLVLTKKYMTFDRSAGLEVSLRGSLTEAKVYSTPICTNTQSSSGLHLI
jgi:hypothetical protein